MSMHTGTVKWFDNERGYGFIAGNNGKDVYVHSMQIKEKLLIRIYTRVKRYYLI